MEPLIEYASLENSEGDYIKLSIDGYQFPDMDYEYYDSNWLLINGDLSHQGSKYLFTDPCLLTRDVTKLSDWLEQVANWDANTKKLGFTEPCLSFELMPSNLIRVNVNLMAHPVLLSSDSRVRIDLCIDIPIITKQLMSAANNLRAQLRNYPARVQ